MSKLISACCRADMVVVGDSYGEGTNHYECKACKESCSFIDPKQELEENARLAKEYRNAPNTGTPKLDERVLLALAKPNLHERYEAILALFTEQGEKAFLLGYRAERIARTESLHASNRTAKTMTWAEAKAQLTQHKEPTNE